MQAFCESYSEYRIKDTIIEECHIAQRRSSRKGTPPKYVIIYINA